MNRIKAFSILFSTLFLLLDCGFVTAQGMINNGAEIILDNGPYVYIDGGSDGDYTNTAGLIWVNTSGTIILEGDWSNDDGVGVFKNVGTGIDNVQFKGGGAQTIGGTQPTSFSTLTLDNSSGLGSGVTLNVPINVYTSLVTTNGVLNTSTANYLAMRNAATATIGSASSYVDGPIRYHMALSGSRTLIMPLGKNSDWRPIELTPTHAAATNYYYTAELFNADAQALFFTKPPTITHVSYVHYYTITRSSTANFTNATLKIYYSTTNGYNDGVTDRTNLGVAKDDGSGNWVDITAGDGTANGTGNITSAAYTPQNTYFTLANLSGGTNPLPVTLLAFEGKCVDEGILLSWSTASETDNSFFSIERSTDGINFEHIARVNGAGNSSTIIKYDHKDEGVTGAYYYRLSQTDLDGKITTYSPIFVKCSAVTPAGEALIFPNPTRGNFDLLLNDLEDQELQISIQDMLGREIFSTMKSIGSNSEIFHYDISGLSKGTYMITVSNSTLQINRKLILN